MSVPAWPLVQMPSTALPFTSSIIGTRWSPGASCRSFTPWPALFSCQSCFASVNSEKATPAGRASMNPSMPPRPNAIRGGASFRAMRRASSGPYPVTMAQTAVP